MILNQLLSSIRDAIPKRMPITKYTKNICQIIITPLNTTSWSDNYTDKLHDLQGILQYGA